jgi:hypothetical protein
MPCGGFDLHGAMGTYGNSAKVIGELFIELVLE